MTTVTFFFGAKVLRVNLTDDKSSKHFLKFLKDSNLLRPETLTKQSANVFQFYMGDNLVTYLKVRKALDRLGLDVNVGGQFIWNKELSLANALNKQKLIDEQAAQGNVA